MNVEFLEALKDLEKERNIAPDVLLEAIDAALVAAYKKNFASSPQNVRTEIDRETGDFHVFSRKTIVEEVDDPQAEIGIDEAIKINPGYEPGDIIETEVTPKEFGRIAAQTAKQVVIQRIREAERALLFSQYNDMEGDILVGQILRFENRCVYMDVGKTEAMLPPSEQIAGEVYRFGERIRVYMVNIRKTARGPMVIVSRTHPGLLKRLFEQEVPEIYDGTVEIKSISREAGSRSKVAVYSRHEHIDCLGACVGARGMRVQNIVDELCGEKIDVVKWSEDPVEYIANALSPAGVLDVQVAPGGEKAATVIVPDNQLSLAIGKEGQNARLAVKLTNWKIDIKAASEVGWEYDDEELLDGGEEGEELYDEAEAAEAIEEAAEEAIEEVVEEAAEEVVEEAVEETDAGGEEEEN